MSWYSIKSKVINFFSDIRGYWFGFVLFGNSSYQLKGPHMREILDVVQPGDVLLRRYAHYLGSVLVPGHYSHAAVYAGDNKIIHMLGDGITEEDILTFMRCDDLAVLRLISGLISAEYAVRKAKTHKKVGVDYDFDFDTDNPKRFYCTEFVDNCFGCMVKGEISPKTKIMPDDFLRSGAFEVIWSKKKSLQP